MANAEQQIRRWLHDCVVALELCPFAAPVVADGSLRIAVSQATTTEQQLRDLLAELDQLQTAEEVEISTTLLVFAAGLEDFDEFLDLLALGQALLEDCGLDGLVQLASFHPQYRFEGEPDAALSHYTNRSPLPVIHLLRESLLTRALQHYPNPEAIPQRNVARLNAMGRAAVEARWGQGSGESDTGKALGVSQPAPD